MSPPSNPLNVVQNADGVLVPEQIIQTSSTNLDPSIAQLLELTEAQCPPSMRNNVSTNQAQSQGSYNQGQTGAHPAHACAIPGQQSFPSEQPRQFSTQQQQRFRPRQQHIAQKQSQVQPGVQNNQQQLHLQYPNQLPGPQQYPTSASRHQFPSTQVNNTHHGHLQGLGHQVMLNRPPNSMAGNQSEQNRLTNLHSEMNNHQYSQQQTNHQFMHQQQSRQLLQQANQNYPAQQYSVEPRPAQLHPVQHRPAQQHPVQHRPAQTHPVQHRPAQTHPVQHRPAQQHPVQHRPAQQHPVQHCPAQQHPVQHHPSQQHHPAQHHSSQQHHPAQQLHPAQQHHVQHHPAQQHPVQHHPAQPHPVQHHPGQQHRPAQHQMHLQQAQLPQAQEHYSNPPHLQQSNHQQMQHYQLQRPQMQTQRPLMQNAVSTSQANAPINPPIRPTMPPGVMLPPRNNVLMSAYNSAPVRHSQIQFSGQQNNRITGGSNLMQVEYANRLRQGYSQPTVMQNQQVPTFPQKASQNQQQAGNYRLQHLAAASQQVLNQPQAVSISYQNQQYAIPHDVVSSHQQNFQGVPNVSEYLNQQQHQQPIQQLHPRQQALNTHHNQVSHQELAQHQSLNNHRNLPQPVMSHQQKQSLRLLHSSNLQAQQQHQLAYSQVQQQSQQQQQRAHSVNSKEQQQNQQSNPHWEKQQNQFHQQQQNNNPQPSQIPLDFLLPTYSQSVASDSASNVVNISSHIQPSTMTSTNPPATNQTATKHLTTSEKIANILKEDPKSNVSPENHSKTIDILIPMLDEHIMSESDEEVLKSAQAAIDLLEMGLKVGLIFNRVEGKVV